MKRKVFAMLMGVALLLSVAGVAAYSSGQGSKFFTKLTQKDPSSWEPIEDGYSGYLSGFQKSTYEKKPVKVTVTKEYWDGRIETKESTYYEKVKVNKDYLYAKFNGESGEDYTLIYYGFEDHNDEWPHATCIAEAKEYELRRYAGRFYISSTEFDWSSFVDDGKEQKFWIVPSSDVDCDGHRLTVWNPTDVLFEVETI